MLKEIFIENYKSLKNARVEFKDGLNIIIGKNGSGKSNLLEFIDEYIINFILNEYKRPPKQIESNYSYTLQKNIHISAYLHFTINNKIEIDKNTGKSSPFSFIEITLQDEKDKNPLIHKKVSFSDISLRDLSSEEFRQLTPFFFTKNLIRYTLRLT